MTLSSTLISCNEKELDGKDYLCSMQSAEDTDCQMLVISLTDNENLILSDLSNLLGINACYRVVLFLRGGLDFAYFSLHKS